MTADEFRRLALALPEAAEVGHMGHPDFRVRNRIFATLGHPDAGHGMLKLAPEAQERYLHLYPDAMKPASGAWGRRGATLVTLQAIQAAALRGAMTHAWRRVAPKALVARHDATHGDAAR